MSAFYYYTYGALKDGKSVETEEFPEIKDICEKYSGLIEKELEGLIEKCKEESKYDPVEDEDGDTVDIDFECSVGHLLNDPVLPSLVYGGVGLYSDNYYMADDIEEFSQIAFTLMEDSKQFTLLLEELEKTLKEKYPNSKIEMQAEYQGNVK